MSNTIIDMPTRAYKIQGPNDLVKNINEIIGTKPDNESVVIIATDTNDDLVIGCKIISSFEMYDIANILNDMEGENIGFVLCHFTKKPIIHKESGMNLFMDIGDFHMIRDIIYICNRRWGSYICTDTSCCPTRGKVIE
jgi:hypothetical protein